MIAIIVALRQELRPLLALATAVRPSRHGPLKCYECDCLGRRTVFAASGTGLSAAAESAEIIIGGFQPGLVISAGFAGSLQDAVGAGDMVVGTQVFGTIPTMESGHEDFGPKLKFQLSSCPLPEVLAQRCRLHRGGILSANHIIRSVEEKRRLGQLTGALAVDMETSAVADIAARRCVPLLAIRAITDGVEETLPEELDSAFRRGRLRWERLTAMVVRRPLLAAELARLRSRSYEAGDRLAGFFKSLMESECTVEKVTAPQMVSEKPS